MPLVKCIQSTVLRTCTTIKLKAWVPTTPMVMRRLHGARSEKSEKTPLVDYLIQRIKATGPLTISDYMKEALTNPIHGYYMHNEVFGTKGDFITSPEISQVFGELLGVWIINEWNVAGRPEKLQIVELGPGRGTLSSDILRTLGQFEFMKGVPSLHLIDASPKMRSLQANNILGSSTEKPVEIEKVYHSEQGVEVAWHSSTADLKRLPCCFIAHEFFDALPIHKFQKVGDVWHEVIVDIADEKDPHHLRLCITPGPNGNTNIFTSPQDKREHMEVSPLTGMIAQDIAARVAKDGGFALFADYGHNGDGTDTFRAFKNHKLHEPLETPGDADLTADVDFSFIKRCVKDQVSTCGPITQQAFLHNMGISVRLKKLMQSPTTLEEQKKDLLSAYDMLCNPEKMGKRFKFFSMHSKRIGQYEPAGFTDLHSDFDIYYKETKS